MNDFLKVSLITCAIIFLVGGNAWALHSVVDLNIAYLKDTFISVLLTFFITAIELVVFRMITGKLRIRIVWETPSKESHEVQ
jgi:hypothetical protein